MGTKQHKSRNENQFSIRSSDFKYSVVQHQFLDDQLSPAYNQAFFQLSYHIRALMAKVQQEASPKLQFEAWISKVRDGVRVGATEVLYALRPEDQPAEAFLPAVFAIEPLGEDRKAAIRSGQEDIIENGIETLIEFLTKVQDGDSAFSNTNIKAINVPFEWFAKELVEFLKTAGVENLNLHSFEIAAEGEPKFLIELAHRKNQNHVFLVIFDLEWSKSIQG